MPKTKDNKTKKNTTQRGNNIVTLNITGTDDETSQESSEEDTVMEEFDRNQMDKLIKTLETISTNVSSILPILKKIETNTRQLQVSNSSILDAVGPKLQEQFQNLEKVLKEVSVTDKETSTVSTQESAQILIEQEAEKVKAAILVTWNNKLISRSKHFWQKVRNENIAKVYKIWQNTTPTIIPRKLQIKEIIEEPDNQRRLRERRVLDMYRSEKEHLELRGGQHEELLKRTDQEIVDLVSKKATGQRKKILINWWKEECIREEEKSV